MTSQDFILQRRAVRILTDGRRHEPQALKWAERMTHHRELQRVRELQRAGFSLAEISLGAEEVPWALAGITEKVRRAIERKERT